MRAHHALAEIAATSSKNEKVRLIAANANDSTFKKVLQYALDPFITFGIAKLPEPAVLDGTAGASATLEGDLPWKTLDDLAARRLTGNAARHEVADWLGRLEPKSAELFAKVLLKDLRAGFTSSTANKAVKGLIPEFKTMLAHPFEAKRVKKWPVAIEPKFDGFRCFGFVDLSGDEPSARFLTRSGLEYTVFDHVKAPLIQMVQNWCAKNTMAYSHIMFDGEMVSGSFAETASALRKKDEAATDAVFQLFDMADASLFLAGKVSPAGYESRRRVLGSFVNVAPTGAPITITESHLAHNEVEVMAFYQQFRDRKLEGAIVKPLDGKYEPKRSHAWMKIKAEETEDLVITGAFEGNGKYVGSLGGLIVDFKGIAVNVGGGFSDAQRIEFWAAFERDHEKSLTPGETPSEILSRLIEVEYHEITPDGSLRHPRFVRFRDDKPSA